MHWFVCLAFMYILACKDQVLLPLLLYERTCEVRILHNPHLGPMFRPPMPRLPNSQGAVTRLAHTTGFLAARHEAARGHASTSFVSRSCPSHLASPLERSFINEDNEQCTSPSKHSKTYTRALRGR